ncbi:MAG: fumarylacetoacetase, partial [Planctomycetaceae bacterium]
MQRFLPVAADNHFPIQNLPYGVFRPNTGGEPRVGVAIGEFVLDLSVLESRGLLDLPGVAGGVFCRSSLNTFMGLGRASWTAVRERLTQLLHDEEPTLRDNAALRDACLISQSSVELLLPVEIPDYTDFYSSLHHATNVGTMIRGADNALQPNWKHLPVAYHGRASSVVVSGTDVRRPNGQRGAGEFGPSRAMDFELEMGFFIGAGSQLGQPIPISRTPEHVFGMVLVNDWSARDIQKWEYQPLGPFLSKSFATSISPWVVTMEALAPFRAPAAEQDPEPLPYLRWADDCSYDITIDVFLTPAGGSAREKIARSNFCNLYWTVAQQLAHHSVSGCNMRTGDLLASGTISGPERDSRGCLLELTWRGSEPLELPGGESRTFLHDG